MDVRCAAFWCINLAAQHHRRMCTLCHVEILIRQISQSLFQGLHVNSFHNSKPYKLHVQLIFQQLVLLSTNANKPLTAADRSLCDGQIKSCLTDVSSRVVLEFFFKQTSTSNCEMSYQECDKCLIWNEEELIAQHNTHTHTQAVWCCSIPEDAADVSKASCSVGIFKYTCQFHPIAENKVLNIRDYVYRYACMYYCKISSLLGLTSYKAVHRHAQYACTWVQFNQNESHKCHQQRSDLGSTLFLMYTTLFLMI